MPQLDRLGGAFQERPSMKQSGSPLLSPTGGSPIGSPAMLTTTLPECTIAILRGSATLTAVRSPIEGRITSTGFAILDESMVEFIDGEPITTEGCLPGRNVIYVLERVRAVQVWKDLVGPAGKGVPASAGSLRAMYGEEAVWAANSTRQVIDLMRLHFPALAPPPSSTPSISSRSSITEGVAFEKRVFTFSNEDSPTKSVASREHRRAMDQKIRETSEGAPSLSRSATSDSLAGASVSNRSHPSASPTSSFRARPVPTTTGTAKITPRLSKAAALRMGVEWEPSPRRERPAPGSRQPDLITPGVNQRPVDILPKSLATPAMAPRPTKSSALRAGGVDSLPSRPDSVQRARKTEAEIFQDTPGHRFFRRASLQVASTAAPSMPPRQTKASALRAGVEPAVAKSRREISPEDVFEGVPGHKQKRRESMPVASTAPPTISPRQTRASALRAGVDLAALARQYGPSEGSGSAGMFEGTPGHKRNSRIEVASVRPPTMAPRPTRASLLRTGGNVDGAGAKDAEESAVSKADGRRRDTFEGVPGHKRPTPIAVASTRHPTAAPRLNRAAALRAGKSEVSQRTEWYQRPATSMETTQTGRPNPKVVPDDASIGDSTHEYVARPDRWPSNLSVEADARMTTAQLKSSALLMAAPRSLTPGGIAPAEWRRSITPSLGPAEWRRSLTPVNKSLVGRKNNRNGNVASPPTQVDNDGGNTTETSGRYRTGSESTSSVFSGDNSDGGRTQKDGYRPPGSIGSIPSEGYGSVKILV